jgi:hypothetical protein
MKKSLHFLMVHLLSAFLFSSSLSAQTAQNISFTDLDGVSHDLYEYLDSGYTVILDFSYEFCGPCHDWSVNVGHDLWEAHGPDGDNTLRMFFFDVDLSFVVSDNDVAEYTQEWGVECPVINLPGQDFFPEYPAEGYPTIYHICPDRSFIESGGYGFPASEGAAPLPLAMCQGADLDSNFHLLTSSQPLSNTLCESDSISFSPRLTIMQSAVLLDGTTILSMDDYDVQVFINGEYFETQSFYPSINGSGGGWYHSPVLDPIFVNLNDTLTFVCSFAGDNYATDDSLTVVIPSQVITPTSAVSSLVLEASGSFLSYSLYDPNGQSIAYGTNSAVFDLEVGNCYSIEFGNAHVYDAVLKDTSGVVLVSYYAGEFEGSQTPRLYFNVNNDGHGQGVSITENQIQRKVVDQYFLDLLGKKVSMKEYSQLPEGVFINVTLFEDGSSSTKRIVKLNR